MVAKQTSARPRFEFELSVFRGFSENFWEWLTEQAEEYGYQVL